MPLNEKWHSRLPRCEAAFQGFFFGAMFEEKYFAVAWWSKPVARMLNGKGLVELRRLAISDESPKNTASRMLGWMLRELRKTKDYKKAISYQDTDVHTGGIYRATGWKPESTKKRIETNSGWCSRVNRSNQTTSPKIRWGIELL